MRQGQGEVRQGSRKSVSGVKEKNVGGQGEVRQGCKESVVQGEVHQGSRRSVSAECVVFS